MNKLLSTLFVVVLFISTTYGQSGYKGKTLNLGYSVEAMNSLNYLTKDGRDGFTSLNIIHSPRIEKAINRNTSIILEYQFGTTGMVPSDDYWFEGDEHPYRNIELNHSGYHIVVRKYLLSKGAIAPVGKYLEYGAGYGNFSAINKQNDELYYEGSSILISAGGGRSRVLFDRIVVDMNLNFTLSVPVAIDDYVSNFQVDDFESVYNISQDSANRMLKMHLINLKVGISGLLF